MPSLPTNLKRTIASLFVLALVLTGCAKAKSRPEAATTTEKAATVVAIPGTDRVQIRLTNQAEKRLALQTGTVGDASVPARPAAPAADGSVAPAPPPRVRRVIPFSAVMYAPTGAAYAYQVDGPHLYERTPITVDYVAGDLAVLSSGPPPGTSVVTVGAAELSGAEFGVGE